MEHLVDVGKGIGRRIRELRVKRKLSQAALAELAGVHVKLLARIETGRRDNLTVRTLARIADGLGVEAADLLRLAKGAAKFDSETASVVALMRGQDLATRRILARMIASFVKGSRSR